jgi:hypothetical protein
MRLSQENYEEWLANPATERVHEMLRVAANRAKARWISISWDSGVCDPLEMAKLKARADAFEEIINVTAQDIEAEIDADFE